MWLGDYGKDRSFHVFVFNASMMFTLAILLVFREGRLGGKGENGGRGKWGVCVWERERNGGEGQTSSQKIIGRSHLFYSYILSQKLVILTHRCLTNSCKAQHAPVVPMQKWGKELPLSNPEKMPGENSECFWYTFTAPRM